MSYSLSTVTHTSYLRKKNTDDRPGTHGTCAFLVLPISPDRTRRLERRRREPATREIPAPVVRRRRFQPFESSSRPPSTVWQPPPTPTAAHLSAEGRSPADTDAAHLSLTKSAMRGRSPAETDATHLSLTRSAARGRSTTTFLTYQARGEGRNTPMVRFHLFISSPSINWHDDALPHQFTDLFVASLGYQTLASFDEEKIRCTSSVGSLMQK
jgi:hypothetical protein